MKLNGELVGETLIEDGAIYTNISAVLEGNKIVFKSDDHPLVSFHFEGKDRQKLSHMLTIDLIVP
jgi:hypothetical protein